MDLTERQQQIKARLDNGMGAKEVSQELGISRNAVYQQIQRMRRHGFLPQDIHADGTTTARRLCAKQHPRIYPRT